MTELEKKALKQAIVILENISDTAVYKTVADGNDFDEKKEVLYKLNRGLDSLKQERIKALDWLRALLTDNK